MLCKRTAVQVAPGTVAVLVLFATLTSPAGLTVLLLAALCHELGHYIVLRRCGAVVEKVSVTPFGVALQLASRPQLSYGQELAAVGAGPTVNLLMALALSAWENAGEWAYAAAGAHLVLGLFNLLPVRPLDGGTMLWLAAAWRWDPFIADRVARMTDALAALFICLCGVWLWQQTGSPFLLLGAAGVFPWRELRNRTCKREKKQVK